MRNCSIIPRNKFSCKFCYKNLLQGILCICNIKIKTVCVGDAFMMGLTYSEVTNKSSTVAKTSQIYSCWFCCCMSYQVILFLLEFEDGGGWWQTCRDRWWARPGRAFEDEWESPARYWRAVSLRRWGHEGASCQWACRRSPGDPSPQWCSPQWHSSPPGTGCLKAACWPRNSPFRGRWVFLSGHRIVSHKPARDAHSNAPSTTDERKLGVKYLELKLHVSLSSLNSLTLEFLSRVE